MTSEFLCLKPALSRLWFQVDPSEAWTLPPVPPELVSLCIELLYFYFTPSPFYFCLITRRSSRLHFWASRSHRCYLWVLMCVWEIKVSALTRSRLKGFLTAPPRYRNRQMGVSSCPRIRIMFLILFTDWFMSDEPFQVQLGHFSVDTPVTSWFYSLFILLTRWSMRGFLQIYWIES